MSVSPDPVVLRDAESETALYLRDVLETVDVRTDVTGWDGTSTLVRVMRVGGRRDRFRDTARIAVDVHAPTRDEAFSLANEVRGWLLAWPARGGVCRGVPREEFGPVALPVSKAEIPTVAMTWVVVV